MSQPEFRVESEKFLPCSDCTLPKRLAAARELLRLLSTDAPIVKNKVIETRLLALDAMEHIFHVTSQTIQCSRHLIDAEEKEIMKSEESCHLPLSAIEGMALGDSAKFLEEIVAKAKYDRPYGFSAN